MPDPRPHPKARGRGIDRDPANRFETRSVEPEDEHFDALLRDHPEGRRIGTQTLPDRTKSVINRIDSPDLPFRWTLNPYRGCEHGCTYCYARPTHEMLGFSAGLEFETRIMVKEGAPDLLRRELAAPKWAAEPIAISGVTDPYQPVEERLRVMRRCLEVLAEARQPISIVTKSHRIVRDLDLLAEMARFECVEVAISVTTLDAGVAHGMEPRASKPEDRLRAIGALHEAGIPVGVMVAPVIPALTDHEIPAILEAARDAGASGASWMLLRLPHGVKELFQEWIEGAFPDRAPHVMDAIRETRGGALYDSGYGSRMRGTGPRAEQIRQVFESFRKRLGLEGQRLGRLSGRHFRPPASAGGEVQLELF